MAKRFTPEDITRMCELYRQGNSVRMVAAKFAASYGGVNHILRANGVQLRSRAEAANLMVVRFQEARKAKKAKTAK